MINYHYTKNWRALLLVLPLLLSSMTGKANYNISFGNPEEDRNVLIDGTGADLWTYSTEGTVSDLRYSANLGGLSFYLEKSENGDGSLSLTTVKNFSGILQSINLFGDMVDRLVIKVYAGQRELGEMKYNGKVYAISSLEAGLADEPITLKFMIATTTNNNDGQNQLINGWNINGQNNNYVASGVQVSGLSRVEIAVDETIAPLGIDKPVTFDPSELETADLSNYSYKGILFTLNESNDDGFENEDGEGVIYMGSILTDAAVEEVNNKIKSPIVPYRPGYDSYAEDFSGGITTMVSNGKGIIHIEAENDAGYAFHVKIGDQAPVEVASTTRQWLEVPCEVDKDTYVYIYMVEAASSVRAGTRIGRRATAHGKFYSTKFTSIGSIIGDANNDGDVNVADLAAVVNCIMGKADTDYDKDLADVNGDGDVNVADIAAVVNMILYGSVTPPAKSRQQMNVIDPQ